MYYPQWLFLIPLAVICYGIHLTFKYGMDWSTFMFQLWSGLLSVLVSAQWIISNLWYQAWWLKSDKPKESHAVEKPAPDGYKSIPNLSLVKVYPQEAEYPALNYERHFAEVVLRQYDMDPESQKHVNMTETLWVKQKRMFTQKPFMAMKENWVRNGLAARKNHNKNAPFVVADRQRVEQVAQGMALPH
jgi:hypothetical protein